MVQGSTWPSTWGAAGGPAASGPAGIQLAALQQVTLQSDRRGMHVAMQYVASLPFRGRRGRQPPDKRGMRVATQQVAPLPGKVVDRMANATYIPPCVVVSS